MIIKFIFDRLFSLIGLIVLSPVFMIVAMIIKAKMPYGSIFFKQERVGKNGRLFTMYKFRTMYIHHSGSTVTIAGEERITEIGEKLRKYKLDELPQLWNVLKGDMSFVGPRPDVPGYADNLKGSDLKILQLRPGITGPASIKYRNEEELLAGVEEPLKFNDEILFPDKVRINLNYIEHWNFWTDLKIILYTVIKKDLKEAYFN